MDEDGMEVDSGTPVEVEDVGIEDAGGPCAWCDGAGCEECAEKGGGAPTPSWGDMKEADALDDDEAPVLARTLSYSFLDDNLVEQRREQLVQTAAGQLCVTPDEADCLVRGFLWDLEKTTESWFQDSEKTREKIGVKPPVDVSKFPKVMQCQTSLCDKVPIEDGFMLGCGHFYCNSCWTGYLEAQVRSGPQCVHVGCPGFNCVKKNCKHQLNDGCKCQQSVPVSLFQRRVTDPELAARHMKWVQASFVEGSETMRWCPRDGCNYAVEYAKGGSKEIACKCGHQFCFACGLDAHSPMPCDLSKRFLSLDESDLLTEALIKAITKPCPKCGVLINKNEACLHMNCTRCRHEFCWLCKKDWKGHGGGYFNCATYNQAKEKGELSKEQQDIQQNQKQMQKYNLYREKYNGHKKSVEQNRALIKKIEGGNVPASSSKFLVDSVEMLAAGHRLLQWSYCLSYFLKETPEKKLFLFQQDQLETLCHELQTYITGKKDIGDLCDREPKQLILSKAGAINRLRISTLEQLEQGRLIDVLMNEADASNEQWACSLCKTVVNNAQAITCPKCSACKVHGERQCWGCNPR